MYNSYNTFLKQPGRMQLSRRDCAVSIVSAAIVAC